PDAGLRERLAAATERDCRSIIEQTVRREIAAAVRVPVESIDADTTPAGAGLDSLMGVELQTRLEDLFGVALPADLLWRQPSVGALAAALAESWCNGAAAPEAPVSPAGPTAATGTIGGTPASSGQERLWFLDQLEPGTATYNLHFGVHIDGPLDVTALGDTLTESVRRHTVLRTVLREHDGVIDQVVLPAAPVPLERLDMTAVAATERPERLRHTASELASEPFDLATGPLLRCWLVILDEQEHVLLVSQHHATSDGRSIGVLARDLAALYGAAVLGTTPPEPPPLQFTDYARWERDAVARRDDDRQFWARALSGLDRLDLPADRPRIADRTYRGGRVPVEIPAEVGTRLVAVGRSEGCTPFVSLLAGYFAFLHRYTGQDDLVVGTVVANRPRPEQRDLVGFLANTVVVRFDVSGAPTFREMLRGVRGAVADALAHSRLPYSEIVRSTAGGRAGEDNPLFETSFVLESSPVPRLDAADTVWRPVSWSPDGAVEGTAKFELSVALEEVDGGFRGVLEFDSGRFETTTARRMTAEFGTLLAGMATEPDIEIAAADVLPPEERRMLLTGWNDTVAAVPDTVAFPHLFEQQVRRTPDRVAVAHQDRDVTYRELNVLANRLARHLRARGAQRGDVVGLLMPRGLDLLVSMLAVFKAGAAYVPLDPNHPAHRHLQVLDGAGVRLLVGSATLSDELAAGAAAAERALSCEIVPTTGIATLTGPDSDLGLTIGPDDLAYVIFTSGSTGAPKGAMVEHLGMINHLFAKIHDLALHDGDAVAQTASQCFDISVWQFLSALLVGGRVDIVPETAATDPLELLDRTARTATTILEIVPSLLRVALDELETSRSGAGFPALRWLLVTGEALPPELARRWFSRLPDIPLLNAYGPTECSDDVAHYAIHEAGVLDAVNTPIGRPVLNTRLYILDGHRQPVPIGVLGELYVSGHGVGRGYAGRSDLTAERFVPDSLSGIPGARMYRTGDVVRWLADGRIEFIGRVDNQVKVRGFRIELGEVEAVLGEHPGVQDVAVVVDEGAGGDRSLVGHVVLRGVDVDELREWTGSRLPAYMVPSVLVVLDRLPLTANGKVDRAALPAVSAGDRPGADYVPPATPTEELVAGLWAEILGLERVGSRDDFFLLGGHSLLATQVVARIRRVFGIEVPLRRLFGAPTVAGFARVMEQLRADGASAALPEIERTNRDAALPVSFAQQRLWFLDRLSPGEVTYNLPGAVRIEGPLGVAALRAALAGVVRRHEALRTTFAEAGEDLMQVVDGDVELALPVAEVTTGDVEEALAAEAREPFNLARGPLLRARLLRVGVEDHVLAVTMHHIVSDGWSMGVLVREVSALYGGVVLPVLPVQYVDYAAWQRGWLSGSVLDGQIDFWRSALAGVPAALELPTDRPRPVSRSGRGRQFPVSLDAGLVGGLRRVAQAEGATLFMALLGGFQVVLGRFACQDDVVVGSPIAGRTRSELEGLIGFFVNTLVLRGDVSGGPGFRELLGRVRGVTLDAYAHQDVPFEKLVEVLAPPRDLGRTPLFQVMFILQNAPAVDLRLGAASVTPVVVDTGTSKFDVTLSLTESADGGVSGYVEYDTDIFDESSVARLVKGLEVLLAAAVEDPERSVMELPLLSDGERSVVLGMGNDTGAVVPDVGVHELFERQVASTPDAVALVEGDRRVTYRELDERANRIAHHLLA
ncbi:MAG: amino acid adenylation domain-containing protein, partial [Actinomycetota bacterium]|nr:amino acid adenylation domain-containing protein [Actinomycetota bacterium]